MLIKNLKFAGIVLSEERKEQGMIPLKNLKEVILDKMAKRKFVSFMELCLLTDTPLDERMYEEYKYFFEENWRFVELCAGNYSIESENGGVYCLSVLPETFKDFIENKSNKEYRTYDLLIDNPVLNAINSYMFVEMEDISTLFDPELEASAFKTLMDLHEKDPSTQLELQGIDHYSIRREDGMFKFDLVAKQYDKYGYLTHTKKIKTFRIVINTLDSAGMEVDDFKLLNCRILSK